MLRSICWKKQIKRILIYSLLYFHYGLKKPMRYAKQRYSYPSFNKKVSWGQSENHNVILKALSMPNRICLSFIHISNSFTRKKRIKYHFWFWWGKKVSKGQRYHLGHNVPTVSWPNLTQLILSLLTDSSWSLRSLRLGILT